MNANYPQPDPNQPWRYPDPVPVKPARKRRWPWILGGTIAAFVVVGSCSAAIAPAPTPPLSDTASPARSVPGASGPAPLSPVELPPVAQQIPTPPEPAPMPELPDAYTAGVYEVGDDMPAGKYKTTGPDESDLLPHCYWERAKDASGELDSIIANDNLQGPGIVTVKPGEVVTFSGSCAWTGQ